MINLEIRNIRLDGGTQPRAGINQQVVADYAQDIKDGATFPPVVVYHDGTNYWLADGFHRLAAHKFAQKQRVLADVRQGTVRDAILYSVGANATHGLQRSREDKRRAVTTLLTDVDWGQWSDRLISKQCNVSHTYVANIRAELGLTGNVASENGRNGRKFVTKHGTEATMTLPPKVKEIIKDRLLQRFKTTDPATLASHTRAVAASKGDRHLYWEMLFKQGISVSNDTVFAVLVDLANEWQAQVPQQPAPHAPQIPALLRLVDAVKSISPKGHDQVQQHCEGFSLKESFAESHPVWIAMEELLCALRPN